VWIKRSSAIAATRLLLDAPLPVMFFLAVARGAQQPAVQAALLLLLLRFPDAFSAGLASAVALRVSDHLSAAHALRARAAAAAAAVAALMLAAAVAAAAALALPYACARFCPALQPLETSVIASAAAAAAAATAAASAEGLLYGQGRVAIINASGIFANWVRLPPVAAWCSCSSSSHCALR
jgi:Na+-driven multidrug efflux pump